jgi:hypothetical protein
MNSILYFQEIIILFPNNIYYGVKYYARLNINQTELGIKSLHMLCAFQI